MTKDERIDPSTEESTEERSIPTPTWSPTSRIDEHHRFTVCVRQRHFYDYRLKRADFSSSTPLHSLARSLAR